MISSETFVDDFAAFILTHGRAENVVTYKSLRRSGYTGRIYLLVDDEDSQIDQYKELYGDQVIVFSKQKAMDLSDAGDNFQNRKVILYARNINFEIAKQLGLKYFVQFDDDYPDFIYPFDNEKNYITKRNRVKNLDAICRCIVQFLLNTNMDSVAMSQKGDFIGGGKGRIAKCHYADKFLRKAMNSFFCRTDRPLHFRGSLNDDVNLYVTDGLRGKKFVTIPRVCLIHNQTQTTSGGSTELYRDLGTYVKSFYTVMYAPSCVHVYEMGVNHKRLHHQVAWKNCTPLILSEDWKRKE